MKRLSTYIFSLGFLFPFLGANAQPGDKNLVNTQVLISIGSPSENNNDWSRDMCAQIYTIMNKIGEHKTNITCRKMDTTSFIDRELSKLRPDYDYHLQILRNPKKHQIDLNITNWSRKDHADFETTGWHLNEIENDHISWKDGLNRIISNLTAYLENQNYYRAALLYQGMIESTSMTLDKKTGIITDNKTKEILPYRKAFEQFIEESDRKYNWVRTMTELGVLMGGGMALYYKNLSYNQVDFDYGLTDGLRKKYITFDAIRFDDNDKYANTGHALAGALYASVARTNGFSSLESLAVSMAGSFVWETLEYHEVHSINDDILTGLGGWIISESTFQISCELFSKGGKSAQTAGWILNPTNGFNRFLNHKHKSEHTSTDDCTRPRWSEISTYMGKDIKSKPFTNGQARQALVVGLQGKVINIADYKTEGEDSGIVNNTAMTAFNIEKSGNDFRLFAQVVASAIYRRNLQRDSKGDLNGYEYIVGVGSALSWDDRGVGAKDDFYGAVHIFGPTAHVRIQKGELSITGEVSIYGDFAMVKSYALDSFKAVNGVAGQPSVLQKRGYYYGLGSTLISQLTVDWRKWQAGASVKSTDASMIHGRDRRQELVTRNDNFNDQYQQSKAWIMYRVTDDLEVELALERVYREGSVNGGFQSTGTEKIKSAKIRYLF